MKDKFYTGTPCKGESFYDKMDRERKEKEISDEEFFTSVKVWSDEVLPEGERHKYEMNKTKAYIEAINNDS